MATPTRRSGVWGGERRRHPELGVGGGKSGESVINCSEQSGWQEHLPTVMIFSNRRLWSLVGSKSELYL